jgi:DNA-directed RNA polymerase sigma subunit (sigma70/sigma32)
MIEQINKVVRESRQMMQILGREPNDEEIAERLRLPLGTVKVRLMRAKALLSSIVKEKGVEI